MIEGIFKQKVSYDTWNANYRWQDESPFETCARVAKAISMAEKPAIRGYWYDRFYDLLAGQYFTGAGRITSNAGTGLEGSSFVNCFVSGISGFDCDSIEGIYGELLRQATILKSEGGYGMNFGILRPKGTPIKGTGVLSPGAVSFMRLWNESSRIITSGEGNGSGGKKKIRKGAMMGVLPIWHSDVLEFIQAKSRPNNGLDLFNISVLVSDEFMHAVKQDKEWYYLFPETTYQAYKSDWDGNIKRWMSLYPGHTVKTPAGKARDIWNQMMTILYQRNEPGILFEDVINGWNNLHRIEYIGATNPCVAYETKVLTDLGEIIIGENVGRTVNVWNGEEFSQVIIEKTGENQPMMKISFSNGSVLRCTEYHGFHIYDGSRVEAKNLYNSLQLEAFYIPGDKEYRLVYVTDISSDGYDKEVFCFTEPKRHRGCFNSIVTANCGEQPLPKSGACVLGSLILPSFWDRNRKSLDMDKLTDATETAVRFLDNVIDITPFPLPEQKAEAQNKRRIGLGIMGFGSLLYLKGIRYGSPSSIKSAGRIMSTITNAAYQYSSKLAIEKGPFPFCEYADIMSSRFINYRLSAETVAMVKENGLRNSHLISMAPTGTTSIYMNYVSSGIEPVFSHRQFRSVGIGSLQTPETLEVPTNVDWERRISSNPDWSWKTEGDTPVLITKHKGQIYKLYRERGLTVEEEIMDYAVHELGNSFDPKAEYAATTGDLSVEDHLNVMTVFAKYTDSAVSKTINVPNDYPFEDFSKMYMDAWETKVIKGITAYRAGTMASVISSTASEIVDEKSRPSSLPCNIHRIQVHGNPWVVFIGLLNGKPYEVFSGHDKDSRIPDDLEDGIITRKRSGVYQFEKEGRVFIEDITTIFENKAHEVDTRMLSTLLRSNVPIPEIVEQLKKCKTTIVDFERTIIKALTHYIGDGTKAGVCSCGANLVYQSGCVNCPACGAAACG